MENWTSPSFNFCHLWKTGLSKGRWSLLINRMFCVPYSSAHLWLSHLVCWVLKSKHIAGCKLKLASADQAVSFLLCATLPGTLRPALVIHVSVNSCLVSVRQGQLPFQALSPLIIFLLLWMPSSYTPERAPPNSKLEFGRLVQLHDFALSLGGFVDLSGWICCKTQMNHEV